jgi:hypothetical integral membrane protein (TIGR02206 family)
MPEEFVRFSLVHALAVGVSLAGIAAVVLLACSSLRLSADRERTVRTAWVACVVAVQLFTQVWLNRPEAFLLQKSLPLYTCDIVPWIGLAALLRPTRFSLSLSYFWGFGLSIWAFVLPALEAGPAGMRFWLFWAGHMQILATAAYLTVIDSYRPSAADLGIAIRWTFIYAALVVPLDIAIDADYGYFGNRSVIDALGPWPQRIAYLLFLECVAFLALYWPWALLRRAGRGNSEPAQP